MNSGSASLMSRPRLRHPGSAIARSGRRTRADRESLEFPRNLMTARTLSKTSGPSTEPASAGRRPAEEPRGAKRPFEDLVEHRGEDAVRFDLLLAREPEGSDPLDRQLAHPLQHRSRRGTHRERGARAPRAVRAEHAAFRRREERFV